MANIVDKLQTEIDLPSSEGHSGSLDANAVYLAGCKKILESFRIKLLTVEDPETKAEIERVIAFNESEIGRSTDTLESLDTLKIDNLSAMRQELLQSLQEQKYELELEQKRLKFKGVDSTNEEIDYLIGLVAALEKTTIKLNNNELN
jgi:uncharacterized protein YfbU (UPF0304 family)